MKAEKKVVDWDLVAADYRADVKTIRQIGAEYGISHTMVSKRAKADGWTRDLVARIQAKAEDKVSRAAVSREVSTASVATEAAAVDANAEMQFRIRMEHRQDIGRTRGLFRTLLEELEVVSDPKGQELIEKLVEIVEGPRDGETEEQSASRAERMRRQLAKLLDGPTRVDSAKKLTDMLEKLVRLEREAFGIDNNKGGDGAYEETLRRVLSMP